MILWLAACGAPEPPAVEAVAPSAGERGWSRSFANDRPATAAGGEPQLAVIGLGDGIGVAGGHPGAVDLGGGPHQSGPLVDVQWVGALGEGGAHVWSRALRGSAGSTFADLAAVEGDALALVEVHGGTVELGGATLSPRGTDLLLARFGPGGEVRWARLLGDEREDRWGSLVVSGDALYVAWSAEPATNGGPPERAKAAIRLARLDAAGQDVWSRAWPDGGHWTRTALAAHPAGGVVLAGSTDGADISWVSEPEAGSMAGLLGGAAVSTGPLGMVGAADPESDPFIARVDAEGVPSWTIRTRSPGDDAISGVAASPDGRVWAVGHSGGDDADALIFHLSPLGAVEGATRIPAPGFGEARAVAWGQAGPVVGLASPGAMLAGVELVGGSIVGFDPATALPAWVRPLGTSVVDVAALDGGEIAAAAWQREGDGYELVFARVPAAP